MDIQLNDVEQGILRRGIEFTREEIAPFAERWELERTFPRVIFLNAMRLGLAGMLVPESYGGLQLLAFS
jgi:alkylation response protein AidB-like acyl-CoA dehydrogenase